MTAKSAPRRARTGTARDRAADILLRVETEGSFAAAALAAALDRAPALSPQDRALCTELVYGVLRTAPALDARLAAHATKPGSIATMDPYARCVLRVAAYQLLLLERIPPSAAVNAAVDAINKDRSKGLSGFVNALLRKVASERAERECASRRLAFAVESIDGSVRDELAQALGSASDAESVLRAMFSRRPATDLRVEGTRCTREELAKMIREARPDADVRDGALSPWALSVSGAGDLRTSELYRERGLFSVQEEGAQAIALASGARPGTRVFDACAGRGGKSAALASMMGGAGLLHAADAFPEKAARGREELERLGLLRPSLSYVAVGADLTVGVGALKTCVPEGGYDLVLVDAPCSGLGTLARRPDILARRAAAKTPLASAAVAATTDDSDELPSREGSARASRVAIDELQRGILRTSATLVRPGATLLYAVCTLTAREGVGMREWFLRETQGAFEPMELEGERAVMVPERLRPAIVTLRPDRDGTDGFVFWRVRRRG
jgi:16S rRNA (cytosine967-C5)-methyltransferase